MHSPLTLLLTGHSPISFFSHSFSIPWPAKVHVPHWQHPTCFAQESSSATKPTSQMHKTHKSVLDGCADQVQHDFSQDICFLTKKKKLNIPLLSALDAFINSVKCLKRVTIAKSELCRSQDANALLHSGHCLLKG